jgi:hypothetical protein
MRTSGVAILNEAVLTLVVERPGRPYEVSKRYSERYRPFADRPRGVFEAWPRLLRLGWIEEVPSTGDRSARRSPCRATSAGMEARDAWMLSPLPKDLREARREFRFRVLSVLDSDEGVLAALLDLYEARAMELVGLPSRAERDGLLDDGSGHALARELLRDRKLAWCDAQIRWISDLRKRLAASGMLR